MNNCFQGLVYNFQSIRILTLAIIFNFHGLSISTKKKNPSERNMEKHNQSKSINNHLS